MKSRPARSLAFPVAALCLLLSACAAEVARQPTTFAPFNAAGHADQRLVMQDVHATLNSGYTHLIPKGMKCELAGSIPQGKVYRPTNTVFSIEGAHVHEAYLVVNKGNLVGFYLPVERAFSALNANNLKLWEEQ